LLAGKDEAVIASLRGKLMYRGFNRVIVDVQGVGYDVAVSLPTLETLTENGEIFLHIHTSVRENALELYGFVEQEEKALFELLIGVSGIGPRSALTILSGISPDRFQHAVINGDTRRLTAIPGIGKKSAERMMLELKEKIQKLTFSSDGKQSVGPASVEDDLVSSLVNLGYREKEAVAAAHKVLNGDGNALSLTQAVKLALKELMK
jgi:holliday junction DNA helicase RuvA